jgi:uncharacterized protein
VLPSQGRSHWFEPSIAHHVRVLKLVKASPENIRLLKELQGLDLEIMKLEKEKQAVPPEISALLDRLEAVRKDIEELSAEISALSGKRRESEQMLDDKLNALEKLRSQKNLVSTNAAYSALLKEIETAEHEKNQAEEDILLYMERADELSKSSDRRKAELAEGEKEFQELKEKNRIRVQKLDEELSGLFSRRSEKSSSCDPGLLPLYERTRKSRGGLAFVAVEGGACTGCSMELRAQVISELMRGEILVCDSCSRLIYLEREDG